MYKLRSKSRKRECKIGELALDAQDKDRFICVTKALQLNAESS